MEESELYSLALEYLEWWRRNDRPGTFSLHQVSVKINDGKPFSDVETAILSDFFDRQAIRQHGTSLGDKHARWV